MKLQAEFKVILHDLELRTVQNSNPEVEIVKWRGTKQEKTCYTLASWDITSDTIDLRFCGQRPIELNEDEQEDFWTLIKVGYFLCNQLCKYETEEGVIS